MQKPLATPEGRGQDALLLPASGRTADIQQVLVVLHNRERQVFTHREGGLGEEGAHVAAATEASQAQALRGSLHDALHGGEQLRLRSCLWRLHTRRHTLSQGAAAPIQRNDRQPKLKVLLSPVLFHAHLSGTLSNAP